MYTVTYTYVFICICVEICVYVDIGALASLDRRWHHPKSKSTPQMAATCQQYEPVGPREFDLPELLPHVPPHSRHTSQSQ